MQHQPIGHDAVKSPVTFREMRNERICDGDGAYRIVGKKGLRVKKGCEILPSIVVELINRAHDVAND